MSGKLQFVGVFDFKILSEHDKLKFVERES